MIFLDEGELGVKRFMVRDKKSARPPYFSARLYARQAGIPTGTARQGPTGSIEVFP